MMIEPPYKIHPFMTGFCGRSQAEFDEILHPKTRDRKQTRKEGDNASSLRCKELNNSQSLYSVVAMRAAGRGGFHLPLFPRTKASP